jgi:hypothetical protein
MRKKILIGVISAAVAAIVLGNLTSTRNAQAQDLPKPPEPAKKDDNLFDLLKKELDAKNGLPTPSALPQPAPVQSPTLPPPMKVEDKGSTLTFPAITQGNDKPVSAPIEKNVTAKPTTFPPIEPMKPNVAPSVPMPTIQPAGGFQAPVPAPKEAGIKPAVGPDTAAPTQIAPPKTLVTPPTSIEPTAPKFADPVQRPATPAIVQQPAKPASSPWALHVEVVEGKTIVTATVNKKHEFKIICDSLDLQTGKGTLKAVGKVRIKGEALQGHCNELAIPLNEDRLVLDGNAEVRIQRVTTTVSETNPASFELKGDSLNLRISELQSAHLIETHWRRTDEAGTRNRVVPASMTTDNKAWSSWGTLRRSSEKIDGQPVWRLENTTGTVIATLLPRDGGTLAQYEGRNISVFGTNEQVSGRTVLRVSHIALP